MTNYNDGKWHGWNGGECPVHPKTKIRIMDAGEGSDIVCDARYIRWSFSGAFRVIQEYRQPREFWLNPLSGSWSERREDYALDAPVILVRELMAMEEHND